jgi:APA family basic amino acid/polyamine antiporter
MAALTPALFAYGGWQQALWIAGEVRDPQRNLPRAIVGGVIVVIIVYLLANWSYFHLLGVERVAQSKAVAADAVSVAAPRAGRRIIAAAVAVSAFGVLNAQLLSGPRLLFGLARDGRFFTPFRSLSPRFGTPVAAISLLTIMSLVILVVALSSGGTRPIDQLLNGTMFIDVTFFALTGAALIILRRTRPAAHRAVRVPGYPIVPLLFVIGELGALVGAMLDETVRTAAIIGAIWIAIAGLIYAIWFRRVAGIALPLS